ncbi:MAG: PEGA domain-containing protein [Myxococcales bacterium]|nr:PEGA domain-containing protein [Myxococcales bacterium]
MVRRLLVCWSLAAAVSPVRAEDRDSARIHFEAAQAAERRGDWQVVLDEYERAYTLAPHPTVLFNMAKAYEKLSRFREAAEALRRYLRDSPYADDRAEVEARIERARDRPSRVRVAFPPGATLFVDGVPQGEVPVELELPAGRHVMHVERDADRSRDQEVVLGYGDPAEPAFELEKAPPVTPSGGRPPTLTIGAALGFATGIASAWDTSVAVSLSGRLGGSFALGDKLRVIFDLGATFGPSIEDARISSDLGPKERYVLFQPRAGVSYELWRKGGMHLDAFGEGALVLGYHTLSFGMEEVSKQGVSGAGAGGGVGFFGSSERSPRQQYFVSAAYFYLPASVGDNTGYRSQGVVNVGGFEITAGWSVLIGPLATKPVSR